MAANTSLVKESAPYALAAIRNRCVVAAKHLNHTGCEAEHFSAPRELHLTYGARSIILEAFEDVQCRCDPFRLNKCVSDTVKRMYKKLEMESVLRGKKTDATIAEKILFGCRMKKFLEYFRRFADCRTCPSNKLDNATPTSLKLSH